MFRKIKILNINLLGITIVDRSNHKLFKDHNIISVPKPDIPIYDPPTSQTILIKYLQQNLAESNINDPTSSCNIDHVATQKQRRKLFKPIKSCSYVPRIWSRWHNYDLREDRRHIRDDDINEISLRTFPFH